MFRSIEHWLVRRVQQNVAIELLESRRLLSGEIFVCDATAGTIQEYDSSGNLINATLVSGLSTPQGLAISGSDLFVVNAGSGTVGEYTTSGATVNASLITGLNQPDGISVSGAALFVTSGSTGGGISEYSTTGATGNASLLTGIALPTNVAANGTDVYVNDDGNNQTDVYDVSSLSSSGKPSYLFEVPNSDGVAASGSDIFVGTNQNSIGEYNSSGTLVNTINTVISPFSLVVSGSNLFVLGELTNSNSQTYEELAEYDTSGNLESASLLPATNDDLDAFAVAGSENSSSINQLAFAEQPAGAAGKLNTVQVDIEGANGNVVASDNSNVTLNTTYILTGTTTVAAVNGVATFNNLSLIEGGNGVTLTAEDGADVPTTSLPFNITTAGSGGGGGGGGGSAQAVIVTQPSSAAAGAKLSSLSVDLENSAGTVDNTAKSKVTLTISNGPGGGKILGATTVTARNGVATFKNLSLRTAGSYTLEATAASFTSGESSPITISAAAVKKIVFNPEPGNVVSGTSFNVDVEVTDDYGNAAGDGGSVSLDLKSSPKDSALDGTLTATVANGVANFDGLVLDTAGSYTLGATDGKSKAASKKFTVT